MAGFDVEIYQERSGKQPFRDWLYSLRDIRTQARIEKRLRRISHGNLGDTKSVGNGVFELRFDIGPGYRIYYGRVGNTVILLLCGGDKSSQKKDIEQAKTMWNDYQER